MGGVAAAMKLCTARRLAHMLRMPTPAVVQLLPLMQVDARGAFAITAAAFVANLFESWLGATAQGRLAWLSNDVVNVLQISVAALLAMALVQGWVVSVGIPG